MQLWHSPFFDGGVEKTRLCLFILLNSEKNEPRSSGSYRAIRLVATVAVGVCGTRSAWTVLALFPPSPLRLHRPIKADRGLCICLYSNPLALRALPLYSLQEHRGRGLKSGLFPYAVFVPRHAAGHGKGRSETSLFYCCFGFSVTTYRLSYILLRATPPCRGTRQGEEGVNAL